MQTYQSISLKPREWNPWRGTHVARIWPAIAACELVNTFAADAPPRPAAGERWIHLAFSAPSLSLPAVFDQQTVVVLEDGRLMTILPEGNSPATSSDRGHTWPAPRALRTAPDLIRPPRGPFLRTQSETLILLFQKLAELKNRWDQRCAEAEIAARSRESMKTASPLPCVHLPQSNAHP